MRAAFGRPGFVVLTIVQFLYPMIGENCLILWWWLEVIKDRALQRLWGQGHLECPIPYSWCRCQLALGVILSLADPRVTAAINPLHEGDVKNSLQEMQNTKSAVH